MLANSVDPDQMLRSAVSDLGLHCLPRSQKRDTRLIWAIKLNSIMNLTVSREFSMAGILFHIRLQVH